MEQNIANLAKHSWPSNGYFSVPTVAPSAKKIKKTLICQLINFRQMGRAINKEQKNEEVCLSCLRLLKIKCLHSSNSACLLIQKHTKKFPL